MKHTDICVVGGGLVGLATALAFSAQGRKVKLLESANLTAAEPDFMDARSIALSHASIQIFRALGLWPALQSAAAPIRHIHVSSRGHFGVTRLDANALKLDAMGYVVEYHRLMQELLNGVKRDPAIDIISPASFVGLEPESKSVTLHYQQDGDDKTLATSMLIVADGAQSSVRDVLGIDNEVVDFRQQAIIANVELSRPATGVAYERFTSNGPIAMLPLPEKRYAMVWVNPPSRAEDLMGMSDEDFLLRFYSQFGHRLGFFTRLGERSQFALRMTRAKQLVSGRCVLIGNAANTLHPVAGQGLNLALRDIAVLYDQLSARGLGSEQLISWLEEYQQKRQPDQQRTVQLSNILVQLFSNDLPLLNHARAGALAALDLCPLVKQEFCWQGMGYASGTASLMRGEI